MPYSCWDLNYFLLDGNLKGEPWISIPGSEGDLEVLFRNLPQNLSFCRVPIHYIFIGTYKKNLQTSRVW